MPAFYCSNCKQRGYVDFDVCYDGIRVNDNVQLIKQIKQQTKDDCMAYAWSSAVELVNTIWGVLMGKIEDIKLDVSDLLEKVARERRKIKKSNKSILKASRVDIGSSKRSDKMFSIFGAVAEKYGIKEKTNSEKQEYKIYKIGGSTAIPADDFPAICTAIASGFPLAAITNAGKRIEHLRFGQVYKAPPDRKFKRKGLPHVDTHAIVLVGAGRSKGVDYFHFLSSWGPLFCKRLTKTRKVLRGGIGPGY